MGQMDRQMYTQTKKHNAPKLDIKTRGINDVNHGTKT